MIEGYINRHRGALVPRLLERSAIPPRYRSCSLDTFQLREGTAEALRAVGHWADDFGLKTESGLFLAGPFGSGKTHLAVSALRRAVERTLVEGLYVSAGDLVSRVRLVRPIDWRPVEEAIGAELLVLDDLAQETGTEFTRDIVSRVIFGRYEAARPTLFTSNHGPSRLSEVLGGAVVSRLHEMAEVHLIVASDYRCQTG